MTFRWLITILGNSILYGAVLWLRPRRLLWLYIAQTATMLATAWNVWAWYHLSDYAYNVAWTYTDLLQAWCEAGLLIELLWNVLHAKDRRIDGLYAAVLFLHLLFWTAEYHSWLPFLNGDGEALQNMRHAINLAIIPVSLIAVIVHRERYCVQEKV